MNSHRRVSPARVSRECFGQWCHRLACPAPVLRFDVAFELVLLQSLRPESRLACDGHHHLAFPDVHRRVLVVATGAGLLATVGERTDSLMPFHEEMTVRTATLIILAGFGILALGSLLADD